MRKYLKKKDKFASSESIFKNGKWITRYFHLYCDICGIKHPLVCVNELCEEEGYPDGDYCWACQMSMAEQGFVKENKAKLFLKKDYPNKKKDRDEEYDKKGYIRDKKGHLVLEKAIKSLRRLGYSKTDISDFLKIQEFEVSNEIE